MLEISSNKLGRLTATKYRLRGTMQSGVKGRLISHTVVIFKLKAPPINEITFASAVSRIYLFDIESSVNTYNRKVGTVRGEEKNKARKIDSNVALNITGN